MNTVKDILFFFPSKRALPANRTALKKFLCYLAKKEQKKIASLNIIFCEDAQLLQINQSFLNHDDYTDIITFNLSEIKNGPLTAEIYISTQRVRENARIFNTSIQRELHRVIFHGLLHLCGYGDKKPKEITLMREKEEFYLSRFFNA
jgi:probable rRNA maturation factor